MLLVKEVEVFYLYYFCCQKSAKHKRSRVKKEKPLCTMFENHRKSLIQHCERSELRLHFEGTKVN